MTGNIANDILFELVSSESDILETNKRLCGVLDLAIDCISKEEPTVASEVGGCPTIWSTDLCWPHTALNTTTHLPCSKYDMQDSTTTTESSNWVALHCNSTTGSWNKRLEPNSCYPSLIENVAVTHMDSNTLGTPMNVSESNFNDLFIYIGDEDNQPIDTEEVERKRYQTLHILVTIGYSLSLASLLVALLLFLVLKRLHCTRVFIHMNLMLAFVLRGIMWIFHIVAFQGSDSTEEEIYLATISLASRIFSRYNSTDLPQLLIWQQDWCQYEQGQKYYIWCRIYYTLQNYVVTASYYWLLVEGLYLALILRAMSPYNSQKFVMRCFLVLGWLFPWLSVIGSVLAKILDQHENNRCWFEDENSSYWLIIKIPIVLSLLINFFIFILVVRVVGSKLKMNLRHRAEEETEDYRVRLTKSTLALIPLLGIHYIITVFFGFFPIQNSTFLFVKDTFETLLNSFQGLLVAMIYCFFNKEVQDELKRWWRTWKTEWELGMGNKKKKEATTASNFINLCSFTFSKKPNAHSTKNSAYTVENSPTRTRVMSTMVTETSRLSTYSLKKGGLLHAPSPFLNGSPYKETCLCTGLEKLSLKDENSLYGSSILNEKPESLHTNRLSVEVEDLPRGLKHITAPAETDSLLSPTSVNDQNKGT